MAQTGKLFIVSAPSGAGKTSLVQAVLEKIGPHHPIKRVITYTTREPRVGEKDGYDFHYVTDSEFEQLIQDGFFLEWSNAHVAYYGTPSSIIEDMKKGSSYIIVIDRVGAEQIKAKIKEAILVWISVPSLDVLKERLIRRGTETMAQIERRLKRAEQEIEIEQKRPLYDYTILNDDFNDAFALFFDIILKELKLPYSAVFSNEIIANKAT